MSPAEVLKDLCQRYWSFQCEETPLFAFFAGVALAHDDLMRDAPADHERRAEAARAMLQELAAIPIAALGVQDRATHALLGRELSNLVRLVAVRGHLRPTIFPAGAEFTVMVWANALTLKTRDEARAFVRRLRKVGPALEGVPASQQAGVQEGISYPRMAVERASAVVMALADQPAKESPFYGPMVRAGSRFDTEAQEAERVVASEVQPALQAYAEFLRDGLGAVARDGVGVTEDLAGSEYYAALVEAYTSLEEPADAIHDLGLREVARLTAEMKTVATAAGFEGDLEGYRRRIMSDNSLIARSPEALCEQLEVLHKRIDGRIPEFFGRTPRTTHGARSIPEALSDAQPPAYAQPNPADNSAAGVHWGWAPRRLLSSPGYGRW